MINDVAPITQGLFGTLEEVVSHVYLEYGSLHGFEDVRLGCTHHHLMENLRDELYKDLILLLLVLADCNNSA